MSLRRVLETSLYVADLGHSKAFYGGLLGLETLSVVEGRHAFFRLPDGGMLLCFLAAASRQGGDLPAHGAEGSQHVTFEAPQDEMEGWRRRLREAGVNIEQEQTWSRGVRSFYFRDPDGHLLEISEPGLWG